MRTLRYEENIFGQSWWKNVWIKLHQHCCCNMIYSPPLDIMIKTKCSFSTVCVGMAFSLSCTSDDLKWDNSESPRQLRTTTTSHNRRKNYSFIVWLLFPSVSLTLCLSVCMCMYLGVFLSTLAVSSVQREGHIFSYISCFDEDAWAPSQVMFVVWGNAFRSVVFGEDWTKAKTNVWHQRLSK